MEYLNNNYYLEVRDKRYKTHPTENIILGEREEPKALRKHQVINETQKRRKKVIKNQNDELEVKLYPKKKISEKPKIDVD